MAVHLWSSEVSVNGLLPEALGGRQHENKGGSDPETPPATNALSVPATSCKTD